MNREFSGEHMAPPELRSGAPADADPVGDGPGSETAVLAALAEGAPLSLVLEYVVRLVEAQLPGALCSVLRRDAGDGVLKHVAAGTLPREYTHLLASVPIREGAGSCGTAAWRNQPVFVEDIVADPLWAQWREPALAHGLRACWSAPINARSGEVLGTFAIYYREPRSCSDEVLLLIQTAVHLAAIAIEHQAAIESVRDRDHLMRGFSDAMQALIMDPELPTSVDRALACLGEGAAVDRVYLFENHPHPMTGRPAVSQRAEWTRPDVEPQLDNPDLQSLAFADLLPAWDVDLRRGTPVACIADEFDPTARALLDYQDIQSLLLVPVTVDGEYWGFLGFDDCHHLRRWSEIERSALMAAAATLGVAYERTRSENARREAEGLLRTSEQRFRLLADTAPVLIWMADADGRLTYVNRGWRQFTGRTAEAEIRDRWSERIHPDDLEASLTTFRDALQGRQPYETEYRLRRHDGRYRWVIDRGTPRYDHDGTFQGFIGTCIDIDERKRHEEELLAARLAAEEAARLKDALLTNMSHEIRTPLTAMIGFADILASEAAGTHAELAEHIGCGGRRLLDTLNSVLDFAQLEAGTGELDLGPVDLSNLIHEQAILVQRRAEEKNVELRLQASRQPVTVWANAGALGRALANLLSNALKFTTEGHVEVSARQDGDWAVIQVADTGVGIAESFLPHLFQEFRQESDGLSRDFEGNGLGLAITKKLVEAMNGSVSAESEKHRGSTFTIRVPTASMAPERV